MTRTEAILLIVRKIERRRVLNQPGVCALRANKMPITSISLTLREAEALAQVLCSGQSMDQPPSVAAVDPVASNHPSGTTREKETISPPPEGRG